MKNFPLLEIRNLSISVYENQEELDVVRNIDFSLNKGEILAIVGESGSGKTLTCQSIVRINSNNVIVKNGEILFENTNLLKLSEKEMVNYRGKKISYIFQDPTNYLNPVIKVGDQIIESILLNEKISKKEAKEKAIKLLEKVEIENAVDRFNSYPLEFSGGQRQRILIAIAIASKPDIIICDEPTSSLDAINQNQILDILNNLRKEYNLSIILITHDINIVEKIADNIVVMYGGEILEKGSFYEILKNPKHQYTIGLLKSSKLVVKNSKLYFIDGSIPKIKNIPRGDPFANRNDLSFKIDYYKKPPMIKINENHYVKSWLYIDEAPNVEFLEDDLIKISYKDKNPYYIKKGKIL